MRKRKARAKSPSTMSLLSSRKNICFRFPIVDESDKLTLIILIGQAFIRRLSRVHNFWLGRVISDFAVARAAR